MAEGGGFFRGTAQDQDNRFSDKMKKLVASTKFPENFSTKVNMKKVKLDVIKPWIVRKVTEMLQFEDEVVINFVFAQLENNQFPDPKVMQINITGFLEKNTPAFMKELWTLLVSAQKSDSGIPVEFLEEMKQQIKQKQAEQERVQAELAKRKEETEARLAEKRAAGPPPAAVKQEHPSIRSDEGRTYPRFRSSPPSGGPPPSPTHTHSVPWLGQVAAPPRDPRDSGGRDARGGDRDRDRDRGLDRDRDRRRDDRDDDRRRRRSRSRSRDRDRRRSPPRRDDRDRDRDGRRSPPKPRDRSRDDRGSRDGGRDRRRGRSSSSESDRDRKKKGRRASRSASRSRSRSGSPRKKDEEKKKKEATSKRRGSDSSSSAGGSPPPPGAGQDREEALRKKALSAARKE
eukprot:tig00020629_g12361.t1